MIQPQTFAAIALLPLLAVAFGPVRKVTTNRRVVRLRGQVRTAKGKSSIAFKAGQTAGIDRVDDRLTVGSRIERAAW